MSSPEQQNIDYFVHRRLAGTDYQSDSIRGEVNAFVHKRFLDRHHIQPGQRILEIGAGAGRWTLDLIRRGALVEVTDISESQLELNEKVVGEVGLEDGVINRRLQSITDLSDYESSSFDHVVAYGGPLSYAFEDDVEAMREMLRVTKTDGFVIASVMSRVGMMRWYYENRPEELLDDESIDPLLLFRGESPTCNFFFQGDRRFKPSASEHICKLYSWLNIVTLVELQALGKLRSGLTSNFLSMISENRLVELKKDPEAWKRFLTREVVVCEKSAVRDAGTHILFSATHDKNDRSAPPRDITLSL
jgi:ubiquinone/menaquinone biosynthesis C-methylase UbiE